MNDYIIIYRESGITLVEMLLVITAAALLAVAAAFGYQTAVDMIDERDFLRQIQTMAAAGERAKRVEKRGSVLSWEAYIRGSEIVCKGKCDTAYGKSTLTLGQNARGYWADLRSEEIGDVQMSQIAHSIDALGGISAVLQDGEPPSMRVKFWEESTNLKTVLEEE